MTKKAKTAKTTKAAKAPAEVTKRIGSTQVAVLKLLAKGKPMSRSELTKATDSFIGSTLGYVGKDSTSASLVGRGFVRMGGGEGGTVFSITPAGRDALKGLGKESPAPAVAAKTTRTTKGKK